jgi:hypothetical protein
MTGRRDPTNRTWPPAAIVLYALGLLSVLAVAVALGGGDAGADRWALVLLPATLLAAGSLAVRRAASAEPQPDLCG